MLKKLAMLFAVGAFVLAGTACNTMEGAGEDTENAGNAIQDAAE